MDRIAILQRDADAAALTAGVSQTETARALLAGVSWTRSGAATSMLFAMTSGGVSGNWKRRQIARQRREQLRDAMASQLKIPPRAFAGLIGLALRLMFPEYAAAVLAINWLVDWLLDRWADDPDELIELQLAT